MAAGDPQFLSDFATELKRYGAERFSERYGGHALVGLGFVARVGERAAGSSRRTLEAIDPGQLQEEASVAGRVWRIQRSRAVRGDPRITLGRNADNDIAVPEYTISGAHCAFIFDLVGAYIVDLGSLNGIYLNGKQIGARAQVRITDKTDITVGRLRLQFLLHKSFVARVAEVAAGR